MPLLLRELKRCRVGGVSPRRLYGNGRELYSAVDLRCRELAEWFLPVGVDETTCVALAQHLQDVVDDWLLEYPCGT